MSSTPQAIKQVSDNPPANAVTAPTDPKVKAADIERKMQLYGIIEAFRQGKYPSNTQISNTLDYVLHHSPIQKEKLSKDGKILIEDFQAIITTAKRIIEQKNEDELFQNFLYNTRQIDYSKADMKAINTSVSKDEAQKDGEAAAEHLRTLGKLIFTNSEARKLLKDIGILGRDVAADAAAKVSDVARPPEEHLNRVDEPAPSNQWVGPNGETRGHHEPVPDTGLAAKKEQARDAKDQAVSQAQDVGNQAQVHAERVADAADQGQQAQGGQQHATDEQRAHAAAQAGGEKANAEKEKIADKLRGLKARIPDEHKDRAKEQYHKAKSYAQDKFPQERRDRFIYRLKKVVVESQRHRDYQEAIEFFLERAENYSAVANDATNQGAGKGLDLRNDAHFQNAEYQLRTLLERFANGQSMQPIIDAVNQLYTDAKNDEDLRNWFKKLDTYVRRCLQEVGYIMKDAANRDGRALLDEGKRYWDPKEGRYAGHKDALFDAIQNFFSAYADDELNVELGNGVKKLTTDLLYDSEGHLKYKPHLWEDVRTVILPALAKNVGYVPIPRIEYTDQMIDVVIENLTLESQNLLPNVIEIEARNYFKVSPYEQIKDQSKHSFWVSFSQIQADLKDVAFYIKKKQGFPKLTDSGVADVFIGGKGVSGKIHVESTGRKDHAFKVVDVKVKIDALKFAVRDSKHSMLIALFKPIATGLIKKGVAKAIEEAIRQGLVQLDAQLADISERLEDAKEEEGVSKMDVIKSTFQQKKAEAEKTKEEVTPKGEFQITAKRESKLVNWSSPDSMVERQGQKLDAARATTRTDGWKSPAFDIVGGSSSSASTPRRTHPPGVVGVSQPTPALV